MFLGVGHALHQRLGRVDRFFVRPNDRRFQIDAARLERNIDDLRDPALDGNGLVLVAQEEYEMRVTRVVPVEGVHALHVGHGPNGRACERHVDKRKRRPVLPSKTLPDTEVWAVAQSPNPHNIHVSSLGVNGRGVCPVSCNPNAHLVQQQHRHGHENLARHIRGCDDGGEGQNGDQRVPPIRLEHGAVTSPALLRK